MRKSLESKLNQMQSNKEFSLLLFNVDSNLNTLLHLACKKKSAKIFRLVLSFIIENRGPYLNLISQKNSKSESFFQIACNQGCIEIMNSFLNERVNFMPNYDPFIEHDESLNTPLLSSILNEQYQSVLFLLNNGANVNIENENKQNALHLSCITSSYEITECLLRHGCNYLSQDKDKMYPFCYACKNGNEEIVKLMLNLSDAHLFVNSRPFDLSIENGHSGVTDILLRSKHWKRMMLYDENSSIKKMIQKMVKDFSFEFNFHAKLKKIVFFFPQYLK